LEEVRLCVEIWVAPVDYARVAVGRIEGEGPEVGEHVQLVDLEDKVAGLANKVIDLEDNQFAVEFVVDPLRGERRVEIEDPGDRAADFGQEGGQQKDRLTFEEAVAVHHFPVGWAVRMQKVAH
jgi:hypothetical protein